MRPSILRLRRRQTLTTSYVLLALLRLITWGVLKAQDNFSINSNLLTLNSSRNQHMVAPPDLKTSSEIHQDPALWLPPR